MNQPHAHVNQPYATLTLSSTLHEVFGVQLYKTYARSLLLRILIILNSYWLRVVYAECMNAAYKKSSNHIIRQMITPLPT